MLKQACQIYVMKYLSAIRRVFSNVPHVEDEGDCFIHDNNSKIERHEQRDLM